MSGPRSAVYASGKNALAQCPRCGFEYNYTQLVRDGQNPQQYVCVDCFDPKHGQEIPPKNISDAIALHHPRTDRSTSDDFENPIPSAIAGFAWASPIGGTIA